MIFSVLFEHGFRDCITLCIFFNINTCMCVKPYSVVETVCFDTVDIDIAASGLPEFDIDADVIVVQFDSNGVPTDPRIDPNNIFNAALAAKTADIKDLVKGKTCFQGLFVCLLVCLD